LFDLVDRQLWVVTAQAGGRRGGLVATFVSQASIVAELPRVVIGIAREHFTWELVEASRAFGLHLLGEEHLDWVWRFGLASGRTADKLAGLATETGLTGSPLLSDALGWLDCRVEATLDTGDRTLYLAEVVRERVTRPGAPLTFKRLLRLAPPGRLDELKRAYQEDGSRDALAIRAWRRAAGRDPG
jgi:flavin reductase (DIM6/NTAB) family NADH-FMN oxidoreductase RutF